MNVKIEHKQCPHCLRWIAVNVLGPRVNGEAASLVMYNRHINELCVEGPWEPTCRTCGDDGYIMGRSFPVTKRCPNCSKVAT